MSLFTTKVIEEKRANDAGLVHDIRKKANRYRTQQNEESFLNAKLWFTKKWHCGYEDFVREEEKAR